MVYLSVSGGMKIDHVGVTVPDIDAALAGLAGSTAPGQVRGPFDNVPRGVRQAFVRVEGGLVLEFLAPLAGAVSPISQHVRSGGGAHHVCFVVPDMEAALDAASRNGACVVAVPTPDAAFEGRLIAFVVDPCYGLTEFLEAEDAGRQSGRTAGLAAATPASQLDAALADVFTRLFPCLRVTGVEAARLNATPGWDSLGHIRLIISLEQALGIEIASDAMPRLVDYASVRSFCHGHW